mgnify:FL=1
MRLRRVDTVEYGSGDTLLVACDGLEGTGAGISETRRRGRLGEHINCYSLEKENI